MASLRRLGADWTATKRGDVAMIRQSLLAATGQIALAAHTILR